MRFVAALSSASSAPFFLLLLASSSCRAYDDEHIAAVRGRRTRSASGASSPSNSRDEENPLPSAFVDDTSSFDLLHHNSNNVLRRQLQPTAPECAQVNEQATACNANGKWKAPVCCGNLVCDFANKICVDPAPPPTTTQAPPTTTQAPVTTTTQGGGGEPGGACSSGGSCDTHGVKYLYASDSSKSANNWVSNWDARSGIVDQLNSAWDVDPGDGRAVMRGSGTIEIGVNGEETRMINSPRLYIRAEDGYKYENIEFTAYGTWVNNGSPKTYSGLTMVARTNHGVWADGCTGAGYMARIYQNTGEISLQKEYYHGDSGSVYSASRRIDSLYWGNQLPTNVEVGIKFVVLTQRAGTSTFNPDDVVLQIWIDTTGGADGGLWSLAWEVVDEPDTWMATKSWSNSGCSLPIQNGDTVLGAREFCFLRGDGSSGTEISWRKASIRNITPDVVNTQ